MKVVAIERGFDNLVVREVGDVFDMPDDVFEKRPKLDDKHQPIQGQFYDPPSWFEPVDEKLKAKYGKQDAKPTLSLDPNRQQAAHDASLKKLADDQGKRHDR